MAFDGKYDRGDIIVYHSDSSETPYVGLVLAPDNDYHRQTVYWCRSGMFYGTFDRENLAHVDMIKVGHIPDLKADEPEVELRDG